MKGSVAQRIKAVFGMDGAEALEIARVASGLDPRTLNRLDGGRVLRGVFQIPSSFDGKEYPLAQVPMLFDAEYNIAVAKAIFDKQGWTWSETARTLGLDAPRLRAAPGVADTPREPVTTTFDGAGLRNITASPYVDSPSPDPLVVDPSGWTRRKSFGTVTTCTAYGDLAGNGMYVMGGKNGIVWSSSDPDGPWVPRASGLCDDVTNVLFGALSTNQDAYGFVAVDRSTRVAWSVDGVLWFSYFAAEPDGFKNQGGAWTALATNQQGMWAFFMAYPRSIGDAVPWYCNDVTDPTGKRGGSGFVKGTISNTAGTKLFSSFTPIGATSTRYASATRAQYGGGTWVVVGEYGGLATSSNGIAWTTTTAAQTALGTTTVNAVAQYPALYALAYNGSQWAAGGQFGKLIYTSNPASTWTLKGTLFSGTDIRSIATATGTTKWLAVGDGWLATSATGGANYPTAYAANSPNGANGTWSVVDVGNGTAQNWWAHYYDSWDSSKWAIGGGSAGFLSTATDPTVPFETYSAATGHIMLNEIGTSVVSQRGPKESASVTVSFRGYRPPNANEALLSGFPVVEFAVVKDETNEVVMRKVATVFNPVDAELARFSYRSLADTAYRYRVSWIGGSSGAYEVEAGFDPSNVPDNSVLLSSGGVLSAADLGTTGASASDATPSGVKYGGHKLTISSIVEVR